MPFTASSQPDAVSGYRGVYMQTAQGGFRVTPNDAILSTFHDLTSILFFNYIVAGALHSIHDRHRRTLGTVESFGILSALC